ncbi:MAG: hypothetical protein ACKPCP_36455 [Sphaerospermopsis kisseleviana]
MHLVLELSEEDSQLVEKASAESGEDALAIAIRGLLAECRKAVTQSKTRKQLEHASDDQLISSTVKGAANIRIQRAFESVIRHNDRCISAKKKIFVSPSIIAKITGSNRQAIRDWFNGNQDSVNAHNEAHGLTEAVNRKGKSYDVKKALESGQF